VLCVLSPGLGLLIDICRQLTPEIVPWWFLSSDFLP
jgi:hypothetical protein